MHVVGLEKRCFLRKYIKLINDMYEGDITSVRTSRSFTSKFPIILGFYQAYTLSPYLFAPMMNELTKSIQQVYAFCS